MFSIFVRALRIVFYYIATETECLNIIHVFPAFHLTSIYCFVMHWNKLLRYKDKNLATILKVISNFN